MSETKVGYGALLRDRPHFRRLWYSHIISLLGDWLSYIAVSVLAVERSDSALTVALVLVAHSLPLALVSPIAGPLADRHDRRTILVAAHLGAGFLTLCMWGASELGWVLGLQGLLLLRVSISGIGITARTSALPALVAPEELHRANTFFGLTWSVLFAGGVVIGGILTTVLGPEMAIFLDACTFGVAAAIARTLPKLPPQTEDGARRPQIGLSDLMEAWRYARARPRTQSTLMAKGAYAASNGAAWVGLTLLAEDVNFGMTVAGAIGLMHAARGIGTGIGPLVPDRVLKAEANYGTPFGLLGIAVFFFSESPWLSFPMLVLWGMGSGHNWVSSTAELQTTTPDYILGRVTALDFCIFSISNCSTAVMAGIIIDLTGTIFLGVAAGLAVSIPFWAYLFRLRRGADAAARAAP